MFETETEMTVEEAHEIVAQYNYWRDYSCSCHTGHAPCGKCEGSPCEEDYNKACEILDNAGEM